MGYEFQVLIDDKGEIKVSDSQGQAVGVITGICLASLLLEEFELKSSFVYMAYKDGLYKIGISDEPARREKELKAEIIHWIQVATHKARVFESCLHSMFREFAIGHEWFQFPTLEQYELLRPIETQRELRELLYNHHKGYLASHPGDWDSSAALEKLDSLGLYDIGYEKRLDERMKKD